MELDATRLCLPTEMLAKYCKVSALTAWEWKSQESVPAEYVAVVNSIQTQTELDKPSTFTVVKLKENKDLLLSYNHSKGGKHKWELHSTGVLGPQVNENTLEVSLVDWFLARAFERGVDIIWAATEIQVLKEDIKITVKAPDGSKRTLHVSRQLNTLVTKNLSKSIIRQIYTDLAGVLQVAVDEARDSLSMQQKAALLDDTDADPERLFKQTLETLASEWVSKHLTGELNEQTGQRAEPVPLKVTLGNTKFIGRLVHTAHRFGTYFTEVSDEKEDTGVVLYSGRGFVEGSCYIEEMDRVGINEIVPLLPKGYERKCASVSAWLYPSAYGVVKQARDSAGWDRSLDDCVTLFMETIWTHLKATVRTSQSTQHKQYAGLSYWEDKDHVTMAKISKRAFQLTTAHNQLPMPFKVFNSHFGAGVTSFWAMLFASLVPTAAIRKQACCLFGSGGSFKSTFVSDIYRRMVSGTIRLLPSGGFRFIPGHDHSEVFRRTETGDEKRADTFGDPKLPHHVAISFEELAGFNIDYQAFRNLKTQLGSNAQKIKVKYARNLKELPVSRTVFLDSNFTPLNFYWTKETVDRCCESVVFSQSKLVPSDAEYTTQSSEHLYFDNLLTDEDLEDLRNVLDIPVGDITQDDKFNYLAFRLFTAIMTYGRECYLYHTGQTEPQTGGVPQFLPFDPATYDRNQLALSYVHLMSLGRISAGAGSVLGPTTVIMYMLRAAMEVDSSGSIPWEELTDISETLAKHMKEGIDVKNSSKKAYVQNLVDKKMKAEWFSPDGLLFFMGLDSQRNSIYRDDEGLHGVRLADWFLKALEEPAPLFAIQCEVGKILKQQYIERLEDMGINHVLKKRTRVDELEDW